MTEESEDDRDAELDRAVRELLLRPQPREGRVVASAFVPVVGEPRSGRTSFLVGLGLELERLRERAGPYEGRFALEAFSLESAVLAAGGSPEQVPALAAHARDLGAFAHALAETHLRRASFPPPRVLSGETGWLVAPLRRDGAPFVRLVTRELDPGEATARELSRATGLVLLVDSTRPIDVLARAHEPLLRRLFRGLAARAQGALRALAGELEEGERSGERAALAAAIARARRCRERSGEEVCLEVERPLLEALARALDAGEDRSDAPAWSPTRGDLRRLLRDLAAVPDERTLLLALGPRLVAGLGRGEELRGQGLDLWARAAARLRGVPLDVAREILASGDGEPEGALPTLRGLSLVATKADAAPAPAPASLPGFEAVRGALRAIGGEARAYEASVTGSTTLVGARSVPGPFEMQARLQVLEPVLDLLGVPRRDPDA